MNDLLYGFELNAIRGVGPLLFKRLIDRFGSARAVFDASGAELSSLDGITAPLHEAICRRRISDAAKRAYDKSRQSGARIIVYGDSGYPRLLREIADPPPILYCRGVFDVDRPCIAMVGSRHATGYGREVAHRLAGDLARAGTVVVSGMAAGIDAAAHSGALEAGGRTIAVLGTGIDRIYPAEHRRMAGLIAEHGAVVTEFAPGTAPEAFNFPRRNRIISGLSLGVVVVEAAPRSGSLITARMALDQNRDVFAVPGSILSRRSAGTHGLIKEGAKLVETVADIIDELPPALPRPAPPPRGPAKPAGPGLSESEARIVAALEPYPIHIDDLVRRTRTDAGQLAGILLQLELRGLVRQHPGKRFCIIADKSL